MKEEKPDDEVEEKAQYEVSGPEAAPEADVVEPSGPPLDVVLKEIDGRLAIIEHRLSIKMAVKEQLSDVRKLVQSLF